MSTREILFLLLAWPIVCYLVVASAPSWTPIIDAIAHSREWGPPES